MPIYICTYKTEDSKKIRKNIVARTKSECIIKLSTIGALESKIDNIIDMHGLEYILFGDIGSSKIKPKQAADFFDQLSFLLKSGMQLFSAIESLSKSGDKTTKLLCSKLIPSIIEGHTLDDALEKTKMFDSTIIYQIKAGSESGNVISSLDRVSKDLRRRSELKSKAITAAIYPSFMLLMLIAVTILMMVFIVPTLAKSFADLGGELPKLTQFVIAASEACAKYGPLAILTTVLLILLLRLIIHKSEQFRELTHRLLLRIPLFGDLAMKSQLAQLCRVLSSLLVCGIPLVQAIGLSTDTVTNEFFKQRLKRVKKIQEINGTSLFSALKQVKGFPDMFCQLIDVGETSGNLTSVLDKLADRYEQHVEEITKRISALMEPLVIVIMVVVGGVVVVGMMLPVFTISDLFY